MISVILPLDRSAEYLDRCLASIMAQQNVGDQVEVIIAGSDSTGAVATLAAESGAAFVPCEGSASAIRNAALHAATGELVCLTDIDCQPAPDWIQMITSPLLQESSIAGVKGIYATKQESHTARFVQLEYEDKYDRLKGRQRIDFIDTYSAAYRREILIANGGFDARFPRLADQELSFRLSARGYRLVFQPTAAVFHQHVQSRFDYYANKFQIGFWKAQIVRRFPQRGWRDSHTPQVVKLQMLLSALLPILLLASLLALFIPAWAAAPFLYAAMFVLIAEGLSAVPFLIKIWQRDKPVILVAPAMLFLRANALLVGYVWGLLRPQPGITGAQRTIGGLSYVAKRLLDIVGSIFGLTITLVLFPWIAVAIKLDSPGPVFFKQLRVGQEGRPFVMHKFRSMRIGAADEIHHFVDIDSLPEPVFKLTHDPRVTSVGAFLRRWSLDELPQFWNVLRGEMSLIGPRPEEARLVALYNDWHRQRLAVKPGISGPMQTQGRGDLTLDDRVRMELDYIENYSIWKDLRFILRTIPAVIQGDGAR